MEDTLRIVDVSSILTSTHWTHHQGQHYHPSTPCRRQPDMSLDIATYRGQISTR